MEKDVLQEQIRECFARVAYTHKTHERMADKLDRHHKRLRWAQIILAGLTAIGAGSTLVIDQEWIQWLTAVSAVGAALISAYSKEFDPAANAAEHRVVAADLWNIREKYLSLITDLNGENFTLGDLLIRRDSLHEELYKLYRSAPHTDSDAYKEAQQRLQKMEDLTFRDGEIDKFLPPALRKLPTRISRTDS